MDKNSSLDITQIYHGEEALKLGLVDGIGRVHQKIPNIVEGARI